MFPRFNATVSNGAPPAADAARTVMGLACSGRLTARLRALFARPLPSAGRLAARSCATLPSAGRFAARSCATPPNFWAVLQLLGPDFDMVLGVLGGFAGVILIARCKSPGRKLAKTHAVFKTAQKFGLPLSGSESRLCGSCRSPFADTAVISCGFASIASFVARLPLLC